ncbi:MAG: N-acetylmuramic acid 6-phosphate etherase [Bacteroidia bacterium]|nr:N-acetylmuramic acid 6-phosphate etherase [Bacteroidia bacterium]
MKTTEKESYYSDLEKMSIKELLININNEDKKVPFIVEKVISEIEVVVDAVVEKMKAGGRLFYIGSGTSGRLGVVDASECPPTYGIDPGIVIGLIAGGDKAIRKAVEKAEDDFNSGWKTLQKNKVSSNDFVIGISASGTTPYVVGAMQHCSRHNIETACITSNSDSPLSREAKYPIEVITGSEFVTGSTRMKAGTAQKLILNMISTTVMIKLGHVVGNKMVDMQLNNKKLIVRGTKIISETLNIDRKTAKKLLLKYGSVRKVLKNSTLQAHLRDKPAKELQFYQHTKIIK